MIVQERDYISRQKKRFLKHTVIWSALVAVLFCIGFFTTGTRANYFTVIAGVMVMGIALNLSRTIGFSKFQDGKVEYAQILEGMKGSYGLFHSAILPDPQGTAFFEHIVVTSRSVYFLAYEETMVKKYRLRLENKLASKGLPIKQIHFLTVTNEIQVKNAAAKIEKDACYTNERLEEHKRIINDLLM